MPRREHLRSEDHASSSPTIRRQTSGYKQSSKTAWRSAPRRSGPPSRSPMKRQSPLRSRAMGRSQVRQQRGLAGRVRLGRALPARRRARAIRDQRARSHVCAGRFGQSDDPCRQRRLDREPRFDGRRFRCAEHARLLGLEGGGRRAHKAAAKDLAPHGFASTPSRRGSLAQGGCGRRRWRVKLKLEANTSPGITTRSRRR